MAKIDAQTIMIVASKIPDHRSPNKYNDNEKMWISENYQNVIQRHKASKCCWENGSQRLARCTLNLWKVQYLQSEIKQISVKWSMPACERIFSCIFNWPSSSSRHFSSRQHLPQMVSGGLASPGSRQLTLEQNSAGSEDLWSPQSIAFYRRICAYALLSRGSCRW